MSIEFKFDLSTFEYLQLAQSRPGDTNAVSIVSPDYKEKIIVTSIIVTNTTGTDATISVFHDHNGTTYDQTTALIYNTTVHANSFMEFILDIPLASSSGNLAVQQGTSSACTITVYGLKKSR